MHPSLGNLDSLQYLYLDNNPLGGSIPSSLEDLGNLLIMDLTNTGLSGSIPLTGAGFTPNYIMVGANKFTFSDLLPVAHHIDYSFSYYRPQDLVDVVRSFSKEQGQTHVFTTQIDRNTNPASEFQWFKDSVAITSRDTSSHTLTLTNLSASDSGSYYYKIWNVDLPSLELSSRPQTLHIGDGSGSGGGDYSYCLEYGYGENTDSPFYLAYSYANYLAICEADDLAKKSDLLVLAKKKLENQWLDTYYQTLEFSCLENVTEAFTYTYTPREYHYTLYYYDQSGQLVKTVPPNGVHPLAADQVDDVIIEGEKVVPGHTLPSFYRYDSRN